MTRLEKLQADLAVLQRRHAEIEASIAELKRARSPQLGLVRGRRGKLRRKMSILERRIAALRDRDDAAMEGQVHEAEVHAVGMSDPEIMELRKLAADCDVHAHALASAVRELHQRITEARMKNGRGPSGLMITSILERCWASYSAGTCLRSTRGPLAQQRTFKDQIMQWEKLLGPAPDQIDVRQLSHVEPSHPAPAA
jgi:hypothetical protein